MRFTGPVEIFMHPVPRGVPILDTVDAIHRLMSHPAAEGDIFNIGVEEEVTIAELAHKVIERTGSRSSVRMIPYETAYGVGFSLALLLCAGLRFKAPIARCNCCDSTC